MKSFLKLFMRLGFGIFLGFLFHRKKQADDFPNAPDAPTVDEGERLGTLFGTLPSKSYVVDWFGQINYQAVYAKGQGKK